MPDLIKTMPRTYGILLLKTRDLAINFQNTSICIQMPRHSYINPKKAHDEIEINLETNNYRLIKVTKYIYVKSKKEQHNFK